jgi:hypothetical protein
VKRARRRNFRPRGFIVIFGWRTISTRESADPVMLMCPNCREEHWFTGKLYRRWFTLFFLPVVPLEPASSGTRTCQCDGCKTIFERSLEQMSRTAAANAARSWQRSIELYNQLRDNPRDANMMHELLQMYEAMDEPQEALSVARHFPDAIAAKRENQLILDRLRARPTSAPS